MQATRASPCTIVVSRGWTCTGLPSMRTASGSTPASSMARRMPMRRAAAMPQASISSGATCPIPTYSATSRICAARRSRVWGVSCLESLRPQTTGSSGRATAPTVSGPATEPRPTSSRPSTRPGPPRERPSSYMSRTRLRSEAARSARRAAEAAMARTVARSSLRNHVTSVGRSSSEACANMSLTCAAVGLCVPGAAFACVMSRSRPGLLAAASSHKKSAVPRGDDAREAQGALSSEPRAGGQPCPPCRAGSRAWRDARDRDARPRAWRSSGSAPGTCARRRCRRKSCGR